VDAPFLAVASRKSRAAGKRSCRTCGPFPMHINNELGDKIQQQASTRYVLMAGTLAIDFRATHQICCGGCSATSTTNFVEQDSCSC
jgi:hypothetical protein